MNTEINDKDYAQASRLVSDADKTRGTPPDQEFFDTLTSFVYVLLRDYMTAGQVEGAVSKVLSGESVLFVNGLLAQYADGLATSLKSHKVNALAEAIESAFTDDSPAAMDKQIYNSIAHMGDDLDELEELQCVVEEAIKQADTISTETGDSSQPDDNTRNADCGLKTGKDIVTMGNAAQATISVNEARHDSNNFGSPTDSSGETFADYQTRRDAAAAIVESGIASDVAKEVASWDESKDDYASASALTAEKIATSLGALEDLKGLLPTDTIAQVVDILKQEVEAEMVDVTAAVRAEAETKPTMDVVTRGDAVADGLEKEGTAVGPAKEDGDNHQPPVKTFDNYYYKNKGEFINMRVSNGCEVGSAKADWDRMENSFKKIVANNNITRDDYQDQKHKFLDTAIDAGVLPTATEAYWDTTGDILEDATPVKTKEGFIDVMVSTGATRDEAEGYWDMVEQHEATPPASRGALSDVASGAAFPEALDEIFPDSHRQKLEAESSLRKQIKLQATMDLANGMIDEHVKYTDVDVKEASLDILEDMERVQDTLGMSSISRMRTAFKNQASNDAALRTMDAGGAPFKRVK